MEINRKRGHWASHLAIYTAPSVKMCNIAWTNHQCNKVTKALGCYCRFNSTCVLSQGNNGSPCCASHTGDEEYKHQAEKSVTMVG